MRRGNFRVATLNYPLKMSLSIDLFRQPLLMCLLIRHPREIPAVSDVDLDRSEIKLPQIYLLYIAKKKDIEEHTSI